MEVVWLLWRRQRGLFIAPQCGAAEIERWAEGGLGWAQGG
tara:strand:- start:230 stop:349 length:120 start_codon:yes stop_codon:yes gene_type:complete